MYEVTRLRRRFDAPDDVFALFALRLKRLCYRYRFDPAIINFK
jgi:hypothetical protein